MNRKNLDSEKYPFLEASRRDFLKSATTVAAGLMVPKALEAAPGGALPTISIGSHRVTRLLVGSNLIYGYSHLNPLFDQHMREWFTDEGIVKLLLDCEKGGINTWQASFNWDMKRQFPKILGAGCNIQFICLAASWHFDETMGSTPEEVLSGTIKCAQAAAEFKPIGVAFQGNATDLLYRAGKIDRLKEFIDSVHALGISAGISTHSPKILTTLEEKGFANDFYMAGLQYISRHPEDWMREIGTLPLDEG